MNFSPMEIDVYTLTQAATVTGFCVAFLREAIRDNKLHVVEETTTAQYLSAEELRDFAKQQELTPDSIGIKLEHI